MIVQKPKPIKAIVTGGAGFIGSHLSRRLVKAGWLVTVIDDLSRGTLDHLTDIKSDITFIKADLRQESGLKKIFAGHDVVFNLAALNTGVDFDLGRTQLMFEDNMLLQMMPLRVAAQVPSIKKFIQISSASVYSREAMEKHIPTPETADTCHPEPSKLGYALAKKMGEHLVSWYAENSSLETVAARFINVYGEDDNYDEKGHFIPVMIRKFLVSEGEVEVFGSGNQRRSFLYVKDAVEALLTLYYHGQNGEVYNVDASAEKTVKEVVLSIQKYLHADDLKIIFDTTKPEGSQRRLLDTTKISQLGWLPKISFDEGLHRTIDDLRQHISTH